LVRILGPEKFGLIAFAQAFMQYFVILTDYGFNLSATRLISIHRDDVECKSQIFWSTMWIKSGLMIMSFIIMAVAVFSISKFRAEWPVYFVTFSIVTGNVLFPSWYFQGMEKIKLISAINITARAIAVIFLFLMVQEKNDYILASAIQASGFLVGGILSIYFIPSLGPIHFKWPNFNCLKETLREGWPIFISTAGVSLYTSSNVFFLGLLAGNVEVGHFSAAEKLIKAVQGLIAPISQAIYPRINALATRSQKEALKFIRNSLKWIGSGSFLISILVFILAKPVVLLLLGPQFFEAVPLIQWMSFIPFVVGVSNVFGVQTMLTFGLKKQFSRILLFSGVFNLMIFFPLVISIGAEGAAISLLLTEIVVTLSMGYILHQRGYYLFLHQGVNL
jgi:PST family polysaccharide transporter